MTERLTWTQETFALHDLAGPQPPSLERAIGFYAPEHRGRIRAAVNACARHGTPFDEVLQLVTATGQRLWVRAIGEAERQPAGDIRYICGAIQDISELIQVRETSARLSDQLIETLDNMPDGFFLLDPDWRFRLVNQTAARLLHQDDASLPGRKFWEALPEPITTLFRGPAEQALAHRTRQSVVAHVQELGRWLDIRLCPVPEGLAVYLQDVTARRADQQRLRLLELIVSRLHDVLVIAEAPPAGSPDWPRIVTVNDAFTRLTGYTRAEAIGQTAQLLAGPKTQPEQLERIRQALASCTPVRAELINTRSGRELWLELDLVPLANEHGWYTHWVAVLRDITERKQAEAALRLSEERFRLVARAASDVIWDRDLQGGQVWWSEGAPALFGEDPNAAPPDGAAWPVPVHPEDRARVQQGLAAAIAGRGLHWSDEYRLLRADGSLATVMDRGFIIRDADGAALRMLGSMRDVTEWRELDDRLRQSQKLEALGHLTGGVAHDFNNLLTVILGNAEALSESLADDPALRSLAELTATAAQRGATLTNRLLSFARQQALEPKPIDVSRLVAGMDGLLRRTLTAAIDITVSREPGLWHAQVDPTQLETALLNLAINARDAMPEGGRLGISLGNIMTSAPVDAAPGAAGDTAPCHYVRLTVSDTGTGMSAEVMQRAVEPFFTTKPVGKGCGLGLSMVYGFVRQSGGHARIVSEPGVGTSVQLLLPRAVAGLAPVAVPPPPPRLLAGNEHILVVEDDPLVRRHVVAQLRGLGYRVTAAANGREALDLLPLCPDVALLLTDIVMPGGINGTALAGRLRAGLPGLRVLFTSGYAEPAALPPGGPGPGLGLGAQLLGKPYTRQELAARIRQALDAPPT